MHPQTKGNSRPFNLKCTFWVLLSEREIFCEKYGKKKKEKSPSKYPNCLGVWGCNSKPLRESGCSG